MKQVLVSILCIFTCIPSVMALQITPITAYDCTNSEYRKNNPDKCASFLGAATIPLLSSATVLGGALALIGLSTSTTSDTPQDIPTYVQPTLPSYNMVGGDVESIQLANATNTDEYAQNFNQYNDIRLAYSIARGYTGRTTNIAILDAGLDSWHGSAVAAIASGPIAPNATVTSYKIAYNMDFIPYSEIGDTIASASDTNIYNASWSVPMRATELQSRQQLINLTDENFVNQLSNAVERDAIFVWAAGNDSSSQSSALSALPVAMPELHGHFINVVAWDSETQSLADYSNACGITSDWCITAPGTNLDTGKSIATGTSFAAPIVSAALAVIREAFPYMQASEITELLFETARDLGTPGVDAIYGHGMLDLERATRPVGAPLVPLENGTWQTLQPARVSGVIAHNIKNANPQFAYFDKYGRAFNTDISNIISVKNPGQGFHRLRAPDDINIAKFGNIKMGLTETDLELGDSFMDTAGPDWFGFIGMSNEFDIGRVKLSQNARVTFGTPRITKNSLINNFSNIYTASLGVDATIGNWTFGISVPDTIVGGEMNLRLPIGRANNGAIIYNDYTIDMRGRPSIEYSISYKSITASFVDNPYGTDEFFILTRGRIAF